LTTIMKLELANPKKKGGLTVRTAKQLVSALRTATGLLNPTDEIKSLRVKGSQDADTQDILLDLIKQKYSIDLYLEGNQRILDFDECKVAVTRIMDQKRSVLRSLVS